METRYFADLKNILADKIEGICLNVSDRETYQISFSKRSPEEKLLDAIFGKNLSELDDLIVTQVYVGQSGFLLDFDFSGLAFVALQKIASEYRVPIIHTIYPQE